LKISELNFLKEGNRARLFTEGKDDCLSNRRRFPYISLSFIRQTPYFVVEELALENVDTMEFYVEAGASGLV
jgi:hypothetical protein